MLKLTPAVSQSQGLLGNEENRVAPMFAGLTHSFGAIWKAFE
jgi:hypothetical protein